ncbi:MAG: phosphoglucosamine mutase [Bacteroidales bacterium]
MSERLFGTDGVRGKAGHYPLDARTIRRLGAALVRALPHPGRDLQLLVGRDTRESGEWIERELAHGAQSQGARLSSVGVLSTPAIAYLTGTQPFDAGFVISASHNPFEDNGIKVFSHAGEKFTERLEAEVEQIMAGSWEVPEDVDVRVAKADLADLYLAHVRTALPDAARLGRLRLAVDCANGATSKLAPRLLEELGFDVHGLSCAPDGRNINLACGSTHPEHLQEVVRERGCDGGVAFDGDGDRAIFVDHRGCIVDGDAVMLLCAKQMKATGRLRGNAVVATVMSNIGLEIALREAGIDLVRCPVGDKYVMEEMINRNLALGGEQSGHVIFSDFLFTGDGLITALQVLQTMAATGRSLSDLASQLRTYPQVLLNVRVRAKADLAALPQVARVMADVERQLGDQGRLLVRYSGTEPLLRIMLEGQNAQQIGAWAEQIAAAVRTTIGA